MSIAPTELLASMDGAERPQVLDVRSTGEYVDGHVPGARHVPFWRVLAGGVPPDMAKTGRIVVYCGHGPRAGIAMLGLRLRGFSDLAELEGHFSNWRKRGLPESRGARP